MLHRRDACRWVLAAHWGMVLLTEVVIWFDQLVDLPHRLAGLPPAPVRWMEAGIESLLVLAAGVWVSWIIVRLFRRLATQQSRLVTCACCQRVQYCAEWMEFHEYIEETADTHTDLGMCPQCTREVRGMIARPRVPSRG